ncbi:MAG TPA: hypothetical protein VFJ85_08140 [Acidimicrobiales bacterium]|nr:hypothetical protein [Acidimicrobiales bacterium]
MIARTRLRRDGSSAAAARRFVADVLINRGYPHASVDQAVLATSEVVTDAVVHGDSDIDLSVVADGGMARVEIQDGRTSIAGAWDGEHPEHQWRRRILDTCSQGWGVETLDAGLRVWFELRP